MQTIVGLVKKYGLLLGMLSVWIAPLQAATVLDLDSTLNRLQTTVPDFKLRTEVSRTLSRAYVTDEPSGPVLTLDPQFLHDLSPDALLFVVAHEYAHVHLKHQKKLGAKAIELAGLPNADLAFDALEAQPVAMSALHRMNRQFELDADEQATRWLRSMGVKACQDDVLRSMDNNEMAMMVIAPSHPGYYRRKAVICRGE